MQIKSFGCSFVFGNELPDDGRDGDYATPSQLTWPALVARSIGAGYQCFAKPGAGNLQILEQVMHQAGIESGDSIYVIKWTWIERFDYIIDGNQSNQWKQQWQVITPITQSSESDFYYRHFHTEIKDKLQSLIYIRAAIDLLKIKNIPFVMTYIDDLIFDRRWHIPVSVTDTQDYIKPYFTDFQGQNFLDWSRKNRFAIGQWLHPLSEAHESACGLMLPVVHSLLNNKKSLS
jgi:hypothetical protein